MCACKSIRANSLLTLLDLREIVILCEELSRRKEGVVKSVQ
jgi:hypothetical protein